MPAQNPQNLVPVIEPIDYNPAYEDAGTRYTGKGKYKGPRRDGPAKMIVLGAIFLVGAGMLVAVVMKSKFKGESSTTDQAASQTGPETPSASKGNRPPPIGAMGAFPRRLLAINVSNYMYMNSIQYGKSDGESASDRQDFFKIVDRLRGSWKVPPEQAYYLTDGPVAEGRTDLKHPPLKQVIAGTIDRFLDSSRSQDRIVIIFAGHAVEKEGKAFLVPMEGEMEEVETLIPLDDIYAKMGKCRAQEKLIIFDVCRYDPGRGVERPAFGVMTEGLEKALHNSPEDVSVWTACSANEYSYEYDEAFTDERGLRNVRMCGGIFLNMFYAMELRGRKDAKASGSSTSYPQDPLPIAPVSEFVNEYTNKVVASLEKKEQKPKLTLKSRGAGSYDSKESLAAKFDYPAPPPTARRDEIVAMFNELNLPSIKAMRKNEDRAQRLADLPFKEDILREYANTGPTFAQIQKDPEKYREEYPVRVAAVEAIVAMRSLREEKASDELPEDFRSPISDSTKKQITDKFQRVVSFRQDTLKELMDDKLEPAMKKRDMEKSKRWLATFDYAYAQAKLRWAYISEYNLAMGKVKLEQLPELDEKLLQKGWRLASTEKMISPKEVRDVGEDGKNALAELVKNYPNTPWAVLAKTQRSMIIGLKWQPSSFGATD